MLNVAAHMFIVFCLVGKPKTVRFNVMKFSQENFNFESFCNIIMCWFWFNALYGDIWSAAHAMRIIHSKMPCVSISIILVGWFYVDLYMYLHIDIINKLLLCYTSKTYVCGIWL